MNWLFFAITAQALWAIVNHLDKYLVTRYFKGGVGAVMIFTALVNGMFLPLILVLNPQILSTPLPQALFATTIGVLYVMMSLFYFYALKDEEATKISVLWQLTAPITYILGIIFLAETLTSRQAIGAIIVLFGGIVTMITSEQNKFHIKKYPLLMMIAAVLCLAVSSIMFKVFAVEFDFWSGIFFEIFGAFISGLLLLILIKSYKSEFYEALKDDTKKVLSINIPNELLQISGQVLFRQATILVPVAIVQVTNTLNAVFVFIFALFINIFLPKISQEKFTLWDILQKIIGIITVSIGIILIQL